MGHCHNQSLIYSNLIMAGDKVSATVYHGGRLDGPSLPYRGGSFTELKFPRSTTLSQLEDAIEGLGYASVSSIYYRMNGMEEEEELTSDDDVAEMLRNAVLFGDLELFAETEGKLVNVKVRHGGYIKESSGEYKGGRTSDVLMRDNVTYSELVDIIEHLGYTKVEKIFYTMPGVEMFLLSPEDGDAHIKELVELDKGLRLYVVAE